MHGDIYNKDKSPRQHPGNFIEFSGKSNLQTQNPHVFKTLIFAG